MAYETETTPSRGDGHGGIYALLIVVVLLILAAVLYFAGVFGTRGVADGDRDIDVRIEVPEVGNGQGGGTPPN